MPRTAAPCPSTTGSTDSQDATGCQVSVKIDDTSDQMVADMSTGACDGVSASGDATLRLIASDQVAEIDTSTIPGFSDVAPFLQDAPHYVITKQETVNGKEQPVAHRYGVPHGWGGNSLMYNTTKVTPAPTSWNVTFDPKEASRTAAQSPRTTAPSTSRTRRCTSSPTRRSSTSPMYTS